MSVKALLRTIKAIELGQRVAGSFAAKMFAEFGAEAVECEPPPVDDCPGEDPLCDLRRLHNRSSHWLGPFFGARTEGVLRAHRYDARTISDLREE